MNDTDANLMVAFKNGDEEAFAELVRRHQRPVLNFFFKLVWDSHLAEDMAQEVFLRIFRHAASYEDTAKFTTFLYTIARNLWIDHVRAHTVEPRAASLARIIHERSTAILAVQTVCRGFSKIRE